MQRIGSPEKAITMLREGNARFLRGEDRRVIEHRERRLQTSEEGQHPSVAILSCSDSRVPVEHIFDCGIGDIFTVRVAGNVVGPSELGSLDYAVEHLGVSVLLVMGHTQCGAVQAAVQGGELHGAIGELVARITPSVEKAKALHPGMSGSDLVEAVVKANIQQSMDNLMNNSPIIAEQVKAGKLKLTGAYYDIRDGSVAWTADLPW
jgi:carbonic anhydrase